MPDRVQLSREDLYLADRDWWEELMMYVLHCNPPLRSRYLKVKHPDISKTRLTDSCSDIKYLFFLCLKRRVNSPLFDSLVDAVLLTPKMNSKSLRATYWDWNFLKGLEFLSKSGKITVLEKINYLCALGGKWVNESWSAAISATVPHLLGHFGGGRRCTRPGRVSLPYRAELQNAGAGQEIAVYHYFTLFHIDLRVMCWCLCRW